jgi:hypothetical protein
VFSGILRRVVWYKFTDSSIVAYYWLLDWLSFRLWRCMHYIPPKRRWTFAKVTRTFRKWVLFEFSFLFLRLQRREVWSSALEVHFHAASHLHAECVMAMASFLRQHKIDTSGSGVETAPTSNETSDLIEKSLWAVFCNLLRKIIIPRPKFSRTYWRRVFALEAKRK